MFREFKLSLTMILVFALSLPSAYADSPDKKPRARHISENVPIGIPGPELYSVPSRTFGSFSVVGVPYRTDCTDIDPQVGSVVRHDQVGSTWYDFQKNGSMGRMISITGSGYRHFSWTHTAGAYPGNPRHVDANCFDPSGGGSYLGQVHADSINNAGYSNQTHLTNGISVTVEHRTAGTPAWNSTLTMDDGVCSGSFARHWDIPDYIVGAPSGQPGFWPKIEALYDVGEAKDYIHVVMTEGNTAGGVPVMVAYERCYLGTNDTLVCQCYRQGATRTYKVYKNTNGPGASATISHFDSSCSITPVIAVSPTSQRVAIAYLEPTCDGSCDYLCDVRWIESVNNGDDWVSGVNWPPSSYNVTNFGCTGDERGFHDVSACYDYEDSLHIAYLTCGFDPANPGYYYPGQARLYHWSKTSGIGMITSAIWGGTEPGAHNCNIAKMSVSAIDPFYHPDSVYLYCIWTQFDAADNSANGYTNGDIYGAGSADGGTTWGPAYNLTNTKTPDCLAGDCLSEHWSSMSQNTYDGNLHIQYICDRDPGTALADLDSGSTWRDNPVMYLELQAWDPMYVPLTANFSGEPTIGAVPLEVDFTDLSLGYPTSWLWDFGDEITSFDPNPTHIYDNPGHYDVKLVVWNDTEMDSVTKYDYIHAYTAGYIAGFVKDTLDLPIYPAQVGVYETGLTTNTDPSGYYRFTNLQPTDYTLSVRAPNYAVGETSGVSVAAEETTWVDFTLRGEYFSVNTYTASGTFNFGITTGDFTGDNNVDIIVQSLSTPQWGITRMWGNGDGTFTLQPLIPSDGFVLVNGYFNSDDFLDFAVDDVDQLAIMLNDGAGNFTPRHFDLHGSSPLSITKGYLDSDANLDVITANMSTENLSIFRGIGNGDMTFIKNLDIYCHSVDVGDFNKDGNADLAVGTDSLIVLLGDGNWNFTRSFGAYFGAAYSVSTMNSLADFNHDGNLDVIFCVPNYAGMGSAQIVILLGDGLGGFSSITTIHAPHAVIQSVAAGDFNGDNHLDIAANYAGWWEALKVYFGDGTGGFPRSILTDIDDASISCVTGDFNKDGNADIAAGTIGDRVMVLLNLHPPKPAIEDEFVITGYTSLNLHVTDKYGISASILANAMAGADYYQKDCDVDNAVDDRLYHFNAVPGRYEVGVTLRPGAEPGTEGPLGIRIDGGMEVFIPTTAKGPESLRGDTTFFTITDSLPTLCLPVDNACLCVDSLTLFWNQIEGTTQYHLQLDDSSDFGSPEVDESAVTDTSLSLISSLLGRKYYWRVRANGGVWSVFSETGSFFPYLCGDVNGDCLVEIGDAVYLLNYLFKGGPEAECVLSADVNSSGVTELGDAVYVLNYLFRGGPAPGC